MWLPLFICLLLSLDFGAVWGAPLYDTSRVPRKRRSTKGSGERRCNGDVRLCSRSYADMVFIGAHNSYSAGQSVSSDQTKNVTEQLRDGVRLLQNQGHDYTSFFEGPDSSSSIHLCHTSCTLLDGGPVEEYLSTVKKWVIANPNEVITILFTNPDGVSIERWNSALVNTSIVDLAFVPPKTPMSRADWPTLGEMIDAGKRIVLFLDAGADQAKVPYLLDEFSQVSENPYNQLTTPFNCSLDRGTSPATSLWLDNHTKDIEVLKSGITIPDKDNLGLVNCVDGDTGVTRTARRCAAERGRTATFILVDFYDVPSDKGPLFAAKILNGLEPDTANSTGTGEHYSNSASQHRRACWLDDPQFYPIVLLLVLLCSYEMLAI